VAVDEMVAFIVARLDEQEERARRCTPGKWKVWGLAEVTARRQMVTELHAAIGNAWQFGEEARALVAQLAVLMLQRFAALDRDHRDYDPGWEV
jgi:Family of unknown function (DUF6221)